jgi:hypothetical protein
VNFKIEVEGIDDVFKSLSDLESGESKTSFVAWANRIELLVFHLAVTYKASR